MPLANTLNPHVPRLPRECVDLILDHLQRHVEKSQVDQPASLYPLLTVNKDLFFSCVERLYRDPFLTVSQCVQHEKAFNKLVALFAWISPCQDDPLVDMVRAVYRDVSTPTGSTGSPFVDYLSYVKVIKFQPKLWRTMEKVDWPGEKAQHDSARVLTVWEALVRAMTKNGPYLSIIHSISIPSSYIDRYRGCVGQMDSMEVVEVLMEELADLDQLAQHATFTTRINQVIELAKQLVSSPSRRKRLQHGNMSVLHECNENARPLSIHMDGSSRWHEPLQIRLWDNQKWPRWIDQYCPQVKELYALLAKISVPVLSYTDDALDWRRLRAAPQSFNLSAVIEIYDFIRGRLKGPVELFPLEGKAYFLRQCRSLRRLDVSLIRDNVDEDKSMFAWAVQEKREAMAAGVSGGGTSLHRTLSSPPLPLVPLEHLGLGVLSHPMQAATMQILFDATFAFRSTLRSITIHHSQISLVMDLTLYFHDLPELRQLTLSHMGRIECSEMLSEDEAGVRTFSSCPKLEHLHLHDYSDTAEDITRFSAWDLPSLVSLELIGGVSTRFNQDSFGSMTVGLQKLVLRSEGGYQQSLTDDSVWDREHWLRLPTLRHLELAGNVVFGFQWSLLAHHCPLINHVTLVSPVRYFYHSNDPYPYFEEECLGGLSSSSPLSSLPPPLLSLASLHLEGWRFEARFMLDVLPMLAPNLRYIDLRHSQNLWPEHIDGVCIKLKQLDELVYFKPFGQEARVYGDINGGIEKPMQVS